MNTCLDRSGIVTAIFLRGEKEDGPCEAHWRAHA